MVAGVGREQLPSGGILEPPGAAPGSLPGAALLAGERQAAAAAAVGERGGEEASQGVASCHRGAPIGEPENAFSEGGLHHSHYHQHQHPHQNDFQDPRYHHGGAKGAAAFCLLPLHFSCYQAQPATVCGSAGPKYHNLMDNNQISTNLHCLPYFNFCNFLL